MQLGIARAFGKHGEDGRLRRPHFVVRVDNGSQRTPEERNLTNPGEAAYNSVNAGNHL